MLKLGKTIILSLIIISWSYAKEDSIEDSFKGVDNSSVLPRKSTLTSLPNKNDFKDGIAGVKRAKSLNDLAKKFYDLVSLDEAFISLSDQVKADEKPDNIDILMLIDTNGRFQTFYAMYFLSKFEEELRQLAIKDHPEVALQNIKMPLSFVFDTFIAAGSGAIPAAVGALGIPQKNALNQLKAMPTKVIYPKSQRRACSCLGCFKNAVTAFASAYFDDPELISDDDSEFEIKSLTYDSIDIPGSKKKHHFKHKSSPKGKMSSIERLTNIFGHSTASSLNSSLEIISKEDSPTILGLVTNSILARDEDARAGIKRKFIAELFSGARKAISIVTARPGSKPSDELKKASDALDQLHIILKKNPDKKGITSLSSFRKALYKGKEISRNMVIFNISADTCSGVPVSTFSYDVRETGNKKKIVSLNYKFAVPEYMISAKFGHDKKFINEIERSVQSMFLNSEFGQNFGPTEISVATSMILKFLNICNDRVLCELIKKDDSISKEETESFEEEITKDS